ncbi:MAG: DUF6485 family protein [Oscillospiraceae bacterium]|nr:DUF6485 family protein [Oscillospiraceae bacterium]
MSTCKENKSMKCPCTYSCSRRGKCCECLAYHTRSGEFPACFFSKEAERQYDRSFAALIEDRK